jgi:hypothetical protein
VLLKLILRQIKMTFVPALIRRNVDVDYSIELIMGTYIKTLGGGSYNLLRTIFYFTVNWNA